MKKILATTFILSSLLAFICLAGDSNNLIGVFGWQEINKNTNKLNGVLVHILDTNKGPHIVIQCNGSVPLVKKLEGQSPEYTFSIGKSEVTECWRTEYAIKLRGHDALLWVDKDKKSEAIVLPRANEVFKKTINPTGR